MAIRRIRQLMLLMGLGLLLAACTSSPPPERIPTLSFSQLKPFRLNVARIEIVPEFQSSSRPPHIELDMPISPENAVRRWVQDRLQPIGTAGVMRVVIHDASATETPLPVDTSATAILKTQQASRIDVSVNVSVQMLDERQFVRAEVTGRSQRSRTVPEGLTLRERDRIVYDEVVDMMNGFNDSIAPEIQDTFGQWLVL